MSDRGEMWVHGNAVIVQYPGGVGQSPFTGGHRMGIAPDPAQDANRVPWSDLLGVRSGVGATFHGAFGTTSQPNSNWFHFSIPTPAMLPYLADQNNHREITVDRVSVYYNTPSDQITIQAIAVSDGGHRIQGIASVAAAHLHGDHSDHFEENLNSWLISPIHLRQEIPQGILISLEVRFDIEGEITFNAAAIHFRVS